MNEICNPNYEYNICGCLEKYRDIKGARNWLIAAEKNLSNVDFIELMDRTIKGRFRDDPCLSEVYTLRDQKWKIVYGMKSIEVFLKEYRFEEADEFYRKNAPTVNDVEYKELKQKYLIKKSKADNKTIEIFLKEYRFEEADEFYRKNTPTVNEAEYKELKQKYLIKKNEADNKTKVIENLKVKIMSECRMDNVNGLRLADLIIKHAPAIVDNFSWDGFKTFILDKMGQLDFPQSIYLKLLEDFVNGIKNDSLEFDEQTLKATLDRALAFSNKKDLSQYKNVWTILFACRSTRTELCSIHKRELIKLEEFYPFENLSELASLYLPSEEICLNYLKNKRSKFNTDSYDQLKTIFKNNRYFNCEMVLALLKAKDDHQKIQLKDILTLLKEIVTRAFDYNLEFKKRIPNLIFSKCISDYKRKNIQIFCNDLVFCEGKRLSSSEGIYIFCRNKKCYERTNLLKVEDEIQNDNFFFSFLKQEFGISSVDIFSNDDFTRAMGAFNRWNEIAERLVCGYGHTGCDSSLIYSKYPQVKAGWAAYATTYWRCSNSSCPQKEIPIKLSHCAGCGKIIDSRFDKISCGRSDGNEFFICMDCGYCCKKHAVSGICPKCGEKDGWEIIDQHHKRYRCLCSHEIAVPSRLKGCLDSHLRSDACKFDIVNVPDKGNNIEL